MSKPAEGGLAADATQITDAKKRYSAGVLKYRQMGYWEPEYQRSACSASRRRKASTRSRPAPRWPANRAPRRGPWCGPTA
jgi:hypothetical protein